jgi:acetyl-CoA C-acetyltransferase
MSKPNVYILGGYQTDFAKNWSREGASIYDILKATVEGALIATDIEPRQVQVAHIGNFVGELFCGQGHLGGMFASIDPAFAGIPASRHEAACSSGSIALLAAMSEIEAGRYDLACVAGVEQMRNVSGQEAAEHLGAAAWVGREAQHAQFPWPHLFSQLWDVYDERYGVKQEHLARIAQINFSNARRNPNAQARDWNFTEKDFTADDERNPVIEGRIRKQDCGRITDGGAAVFLASENYANEYAKRHEINLEDIPVIKGWGHHTAPMLFDAKIALSQNQPYVFPHVRATIQDAFGRAELSGVDEIDCIETHDCFTITEYMAIDHFGITPPGESWRAIENGDIELEGRIPMNPSGGLIGDGHPVGATGIRMLLDAYKQVTTRAGDYQIENARNVATLNIGGSATTVVSFVVERSN